MQLRHGTPEEVGLSPSKIRHVVELAQGWVEQGLTPALVILVARKGVIVIHEAFGRLGPEPDSPPLRRDAIFPLASLTKPLTAATIMTLVEDGILGLNRPVQEYVPEFAGEGKEAVMVHHLLTHTSGLREEDVIAHVEQKKARGLSSPLKGMGHPELDEYLGLGFDAPLWKPPGTEMSYCRYGYELLGLIAQRASGRPLAELARERIFEPLGMQDTAYIVPPAKARRVVRRPAGAPFADWLGTDDFLTKPSASAGAFSTALDMAIFGQMFLNRGRYGGVRVLSPPTVAAMVRNQIPGISARWHSELFPEASWGFGWNVIGDKKALYNGSLCSPQTFRHGGAGGVLLWVDPLYEIVGAYFSVVLELTPWEEHKWPADLFMNAVTAAVTDDGR